MQHNLLQYDADFRQWGEELRARGKCWKVIHVVVMRKLTSVIFGVLKSGTSYDPKKAFPAHYATEKPAERLIVSEHVAA